MPAAEILGSLRLIARSPGHATAPVGQSRLTVLRRDRVDGTGARGGMDSGSLHRSRWVAVVSGHIAHVRLDVGRSLSHRPAPPAAR